MPANFAHFKFGKLVLATLPMEEKKVILDAFDSFAVGVHGPDILFYYKPIGKNAVNQKGNRMHEEEAYPFFQKAKATYLSRNRREEDLAYLFGFICHFALDSTCHPIVEQTMAEKKVPHVLVESSFDRYLLLKSGHDPERYDTAKHVMVKEETIQDVSVYLEVTRKEARKCLKSIDFYSRPIRPRNAFKRNFLKLGMKVAGVYSSLYPMVIPEKKYHDLDDSDALLFHKMNKAVEFAKELITNYNSFIKDGNSLDERFKRNYEA